MQFMYHYQMMLLIRNRNRSSNRKRAVERERVLYFCDVRSEFLCAECRVHSRDIYSLFHSSTYASTRPWLSVCVCVCRLRSPKRNVVVIVAVESNHMKDILLAQISLSVFLFYGSPESSSQFRKARPTNERTNE